VADNQSPKEISERFGKSIEWAREHVGRHRCVDDRWYIYSCLVSDLSCDKVARSYLRLSETKRAG
jgi:hypothetical protein